MSRFHGPNEPVYTISVAARLLRVTPQFLRQVEGEGLISPCRTDSNIRLYSDIDLCRLAKIIYLWRNCGINFQGIKVIIAMEEENQEKNSNNRSSTEGFNRYEDLVKKNG
jgi:MerR family transcriptional regulator/heat shock protein HspR